MCIMRIMCVICMSDNCQRVLEGDEQPCWASNAPSPTCGYRAGLAGLAAAAGATLEVGICTKFGKHTLAIAATLIVTVV
jgi:hypothetical protein